MSIFACCFSRQAQFEAVVIEATVPVEPKGPKKVPFPQLGVSAAFLKDFIEENGGKIAFKGLTTADVWDRIVKAKTSVAKSSYCEVLSKTGSTNVKKATIYVTHDWKYLFLDVVKALRVIMKEKPNAYIWFDIFSLSQYLITDLDREHWLASLKSFMNSATEVIFLVPLWPQQSIPTFTNTMGLYEVYTSISSGRQVGFTFSELERKNFIRDLLLDTTTKISALMAQVDVEKSDTSYAVDVELKTQIKDSLVSSVGSDTVNKCVSEWLRNQIVDILLFELEHTPDLPFPVEHSNSLNNDEDADEERLRRVTSADLAASYDLTAIVEGEEDDDSDDEDTEKVSHQKAQLPGVAVESGDHMASALQLDMTASSVATGVNPATARSPIVSIASSPVKATAAAETVTAPVSEESLHSASPGKSEDTSLPVAADLGAHEEIITEATTTNKDPVEIEHAVEVVEPKVEATLEESVPTTIAVSSEDVVVAVVDEPPAVKIEPAPISSSSSGSILAESTVVPDAQSTADVSKSVEAVIPASDVSQTEVANAEEVVAAILADTVLEAVLTANETPEETTARRARDEQERAIRAVRIAEEARIIEESRIAEERRLAEETRWAEAVRWSAANREVEAAHEAEKARLVEAAQLAEKARLAEEARLAEVARLAEEARVAEEARLVEEARLAEEARVAEEARLAEEQAEEARLAEEARIAEEKRLADEEELAVSATEKAFASILELEYPIYEKLEVQFKVTELAQERTERNKMAQWDDDAFPAPERFDKNQLRVALSEIYKSMKQFDKAEPLLTAALIDRKLHLGRVHPLTLDILHALAVFHDDQDHYTEAEPFYVEAFKKRKSVLGPNDVHTLASMYGLAVLYRNMKQFDKSLPLYEKCYKRRKTTLGEDHLQTLSTQYNLALLYQNQKQYRLATPLYVDCLMRRKHVLGETHPQTLMCMYNLALNYFSQGKSDQAEDLYLDCLMKRRETLGDNHVDTLNTMNNLAALYHSLGQQEQALYYYTECLQRRTETLGADHPATTRTRNNLEKLQNGQK